MKQKRKLFKKKLNELELRRKINRDKLKFD